MSLTRKSAVLFWVVLLFGATATGLVSGTAGAQEALQSTAPTRLVNALNAMAGSDAFIFNDSRGGSTTLRWLGGFPADARSGCVAVNAAGTLKVLDCNEKLRGVCQDNTYKSDQAGPEFTPTKTTLAWLDVRDVCASDIAARPFHPSRPYGRTGSMASDVPRQEVSVIWPDLDLRDPQQRDGSDYVWTSVFRSDDGAFTDYYRNYFSVSDPMRDQDDFQCAYITRSLDALVPADCYGARAENRVRQVQQAVCVDDITGGLIRLIDYRSAPNLFAAFARACRSHGDSVRLATPDDLLAASGDTVFEIDPDRVIASFAIDGDQVFAPWDASHFYVNYFPLRVVGGQGPEPIWASRDLSDLGWARSFDSPGLQVADESGGAPMAVCLSSAGAAPCDEAKPHFCRPDHEASGQGEPVQLSPATGPWDAGRDQCAALGDGYSFAVPDLQEQSAIEASGGSAAYWVNLRHDQPLPGAIGKRAIESFDALGFLSRGLVPPTIPVRWGIPAFNYNTRAGLPAVWQSARHRPTPGASVDNRPPNQIDQPTRGDQRPKRKNAGSDVLALTRNAAGTAVIALAERRAKKGRGVAQEKELTIHWFDVGQGQVQVIEPFEPNGPAIIIDAGVVGSDSLVEDDPATFDDPLDLDYKFRLRPNDEQSSNMDIGQLALIIRHLIKNRPPIVILSHPDRDHTNLLSRLVGDPNWAGTYIRPRYILFGDQRSKQRTDVKRIINDVMAQENGEARVLGNTQTPGWERLRDPLRTFEMRDGDFVARLTTVTANNSRSGSRCSDKNAASLTAEITFGDTSVYFMGDAEGGAQTATAEYRQQKRNPHGSETVIVAASHHGAESCDSNNADFAERMAPEAVIYPAGAVGHNHPRCAAVQHYLSTTRPAELHTFGCMAASPPQFVGQRVTAYWDSDALFFVDRSRGANNRHAGDDPNNPTAGQTSRPLVYEPSPGTFVEVPAANRLNAQTSAVFTTQESGHVRVTIKMIKATDDSDPEPAGWDLTIGHSGYTAAERATSSGAVPARDELRKRSASMDEDASPDVLQVLELADGLVVGVEASGDVYYAEDRSEALGWMGPLEANGEGDYEIPLTAGGVFRLPAL